MEVTQALRARRSVRAFLPDAPPAATVQTILQEAAQAASGGNLQPWRVVALTGAPLQELLAVVAQAQPEEGPDSSACRVSRALGGTGARVGSAGPVCCRDGKHVYRHLYDDRGGGDRCRRGVSVRPDAQASETAFSAIDVVVWMVPV